MAIHLTPAILESAYNLLRETPPFKGWRLPESDDVEFHVIPSPLLFADYIHDRTHRIRVSQRKHAHLSTLLATMAHEMIHMREHILGSRADIAHGALFKKLAKQVCARHGFDLGAF